MLVVLGLNILGWPTWNLLGAISNNVLMGLLSSSSFVTYANGFTSEHEFLQHAGPGKPLSSRSVSVGLCFLRTTSCEAVRSR